MRGVDTRHGPERELLDVCRWRQESEALIGELELENESNELVRITQLFYNLLL